MKFKMQNKQNQLIERISVKHLVTGIDIAQQFHVARAVNFRGIVVGDPLTFNNNEEGFASLLKWIKNLQRFNNLDSYCWDGTNWTLLDQPFKMAI
jgi:RNase H-fold protein (predicted Holliday junction resolvase)